MRQTLSINTQRPERPLRTGDLVRAAVAIVFILVILQLLWSARLLVLTTFLGILFGISAARAVDFIVARVRVNRSVAAGAVVLAVVIALGLVAAWIGPTLAKQSQELRTKLPESFEKFEAWLGERQPRLLELIAPATDDGGSRIVGAFEAQTPALTDFAFGILQSTFVAGAGIILVVLLTLYIAADPAVYRRGLLLLVPIDRRDRFEELIAALGSTLRTWFGTQLIAMVLIGVATSITLALLGVRAALPLGVIAGIFSFIPNFGPILAAVPAVLMGFVDSPQLALFVVIAYSTIQFLEGNFLIPYLMKEQLDLPPALTLLAQVVMAYVFGFLGLFVAIPLLATIVVAVRTFWVEDDIPPFPTVEMPTLGGS